MHQFQLQPVGIGKEQRVIARAIARIVYRRVENDGVDRNQQPVEPVDFLPLSLAQAR
ncbi:MULTISPECIES: hypothetical protein [unclassified Sphingomonas]|uniref:hypothetical protein n=1 Tax=unclassified Sphingomonas TaxID=196159 RepID=UPI000A6BD5A6|nr:MULTISPECIES: hypothetical protein [unclassified Sphingomonas]